MKLEESKFDLQQSQSADTMDPFGGSDDPSTPSSMGEGITRVSSSISVASQGGGVKKLTVSNKLFLDIKSLSKNMQALLNNY